ncbi:MAG: heme-copper oxidase subunit III, partial [Cyanobacteria bacterium P01_G01_bin.38]
MQGSAINLNETIAVSQEAQGHGHEEHPDLRMFGVLVFLCAESMIFLGLFIAYLSFRLMAPAWPPE